MLRDGFITYPSVDSTIQTWQPSSQTLNAFLVAILTTILAYQLAAIFFDILLGFKKAGESTASDISTLILAEDSSPFSVLANLNISPTISRWKFHGFRSSSHSCPVDHRPTSPIPARILVKFFILLAAAPLANLLAVFLTIESDRQLTFADVRFGGIALGLNPDFSVLNVSVGGETCTAYDARLSRFETPLSTFFFCTTPSRVFLTTAQPVPPAMRMSHGIQSKGFVSVPRDSILLEFEQGIEFVTIAVHVDMKSTEEVYRVRQQVDFRLAGVLFEQAVRKILRDHCIGSADENPPKDTLGITNTTDGEAWEFQWEIGCSLIDKESHLDVLQNMAIKFTVIDSPTFQVAKVGVRDAKWMSADNILFVQRRRSFVTIGALFIIVGVVIMLRILTRIITNNDVHLGIELVLKDTLRINRCDSMLQNDTRVDYSGQVYEGLDEDAIITSSVSANSVVRDDDMHLDGFVHHGYQRG